MPLSIILGKRLSEPKQLTKDDVDHLTNELLENFLSTETHHDQHLQRDTGSVNEFLCTIKLSKEESKGPVDTVNEAVGIGKDEKKRSKKRDDKEEIKHSH